MLHHQRLLTPGPTPIPSEVRLAMAAEMLHHRKPAFKAIVHKVQGQLKELFATREPVLTLSCSGTGAMTAAAFGLFSPGETVVVVDGGKFGERWVQIAENRALSVIRLPVKWGQAVEPQALSRVLDDNPDASGVFVQLSETSTGVLHPVEELAKITRQRKTLLVVDGISAVGLSPCPLDAWGMDCLLTGSQKGLMTPPGLALLALSARAWRKAAEVTEGCFYFNLLKERENLEKDQSLFTSPVSLIMGLSASLDLMLSQGLDALYRKQWALTMMARSGIAALGLRPFAPRYYAWGVTSVCLPQGVDGTELVRRMADDHGIVVAGGQDHLKGRIIRIGHMGWVDYGDLAAGLHALAQALRSCGGYSASREYLEIALAAYHAALAGPTGIEPEQAYLRA